ncbi:unnamed protein product, partial [Amoebophrya sp. A120]|eukprot:GSA120T00012675001.1
MEIGSDASTPDLPEEGEVVEGVEHRFTAANIAALANAAADGDGVVHLPAADQLSSSHSDAMSDGTWESASGRVASPVRDDRGEHVGLAKLVPEDVGDDFYTAQSSTAAGARIQQAQNEVVLTTAEQPRQHVVRPLLTEDLRKTHGDNSSWVSGAAPGAEANDTSQNQDSLYNTNNTGTTTTSASVVATGGSASSNVGIFRGFALPEDESQLGVLEADLPPFRRIHSGGHLSDLAETLFSNSTNDGRAPRGASRNQSAERRSPSLPPPAMRRSPHLSQPSVFLNASDWLSAGATPASGVPDLPKVASSLSMRSVMSGSLEMSAGSRTGTPDSGSATAGHDESRSASKEGLPASPVLAHQSRGFLQHFFGTPAASSTQQAASSTPQVDEQSLLVAPTPGTARQHGAVAPGMELFASNEESGVVDLLNAAAEQSMAALQSGASSAAVGTDESVQDVDVIPPTSLLNALPGVSAALRHGGVGEPSFVVPPSTADHQIPAITSFRPSSTLVAAIQQAVEQAQQPRQAAPAASRPSEPEPRPTDDPQCRSRVEQPQTPTRVDETPPHQIVTPVAVRPAAARSSSGDEINTESSANATTTKQKEGDSSAGHPQPHDAQLEVPSSSGAAFLHRGDHDGPRQPGTTISARTLVEAWGRGEAPEKIHFRQAIARLNSTGTESQEAGSTTSKQWRNNYNKFNKMTAPPAAFSSTRAIRAEPYGTSTGAAAARGQHDQEDQSTREGDEGHNRGQDFRGSFRSSTGALPGNAGENK